MMSIEEKLFHGINLTNYSEYIGNLSELKVLELILKSGKILSRNDLEKEKPSNLFYLNLFYGQKNNEICLAFHPNNTKYEVIEFKYEDAFYDFIMYHISIILKENIICNRSYSITGMPREIRIKNSILLSEYIEGIGYYDKITDMTETIDRLLDNKSYEKIKKLFFEVYYRDFLKTEDIKQYIEKEYQKYNQIKKLLNEYGYNIPIIDPFTGIEYDSIDNNFKKAEKTLLNVRKIREKIY